MAGGLSSGKSQGQIRLPSQYVCSLDSQRTEAPSGRVSRTWRLAAAIRATSFEPALKTETVSRFSRGPDAPVGRAAATVGSGGFEPAPRAPAGGGAGAARPGPASR